MENQPKRRGRLRSWWLRLLRLPRALFRAAELRKRAYAPKPPADAGSAPRLHPAAVAELKGAWKKLAKSASSASLASKTKGVDMEAASPPGTPAAPISPDIPRPSALFLPFAAGGRNAVSPAIAVSGGAAGLAIVSRIRAETAHLGRNNVTRTAAYRDVFLRRRELHWALLAHMVSRNGGWNMTDLQGEWFPRLLGMEKRKATFRFLERSNALIFHDAYPQLRLYEASLHAGRSLFRLLPAFGVSAFMRPVWERFWRDRDPVPLTVALIVNEQHYIEERVVRNPYFRQHVLGTLFFGMQSLLHLNQIVFPYGRDGERLQLAGLVLDNFSSLHERIELGKGLYAILFGVPEVAEGAVRFARSIRHTGSRADYAPDLFASARREAPSAVYKQRLAGDGLLQPGAERLYSPPLAAAWPDIPVEPPEPGDWFGRYSDPADYFRELSLPARFRMTEEHAFGLAKIEFAVLAAQKLGTSPKPDEMSAGSDGNGEER
ncbi:DUF2515 domain-containing protein [Paenibacillus cisolokensis]|uniref:DUF2515 domain-containing protein n=1 Tax=Paenibacillus cisolokensis TaxID=1658519 RepID=UPI003D2C4349